jgi:Zn-dependent peptidase ImmA (M78 family)
MVRIPTTNRIINKSVVFRSDADIEHQAAMLISAYEGFCGSIKFPLDVEDIIWSLLEKKDRLVLEEGQDLGYDQYGMRVVGATSGNYEGGGIQIDHSITDTPLFWFTIAHELGHWILHRDLLAAAFLQAQKQGSGMRTLQRHIEGHRSKQPPEEWQANRFATHLLMPKESVQAAFRELVSTKAINYREKCKRIGRFTERYPSLHDYARMVAANNYPFDIRSRFRVSKEAMAVRLEELGLIIDVEPSEY